MLSQEILNSNAVCSIHNDLFMMVLNQLLHEICEDKHDSEFGKTSLIR